MDTHVVIMAGGVGSRLWPLSTPEIPKQFIDLLGVGKTMLQLTIDRFKTICSFQNIWIVTSEKYIDIVREQCPDVPLEQILMEPEARNTAPCIAYACKKIALKYPDAKVVVSPSDAIIDDSNKFASIINTALDFVESTDNIVTIGIKPNRIETGYGYIKSIKSLDGKILKVDSFKEKPDYNTAKEYFESKDYFWNAGIFIWSISTILSQFRKYSPGILAIIEQISDKFYTSEEAKYLLEFFPKCEKISIDYAIMEKSKNIFMIEGDLLWNDLGSWKALDDYVKTENSSNSIIGDDINLIDCNNCIVTKDSDLNLYLEGLDNYIVAQKNNKLMICRKGHEEKVRDYLKNKK